MIQRTVIVIGPGGVGKSPLDALFRDNIIKIDPYRLRSTGPRDSNDVFCAHPKLRNELHLVLTGLGDQLQRIEWMNEDVEWFPQGKVLFFKVRRDWQFLILKGLEGLIAKAEIYAPLLPTLLSTPDMSSLLGRIEIILLNPASGRVDNMLDWRDLEVETERNCTLRGDTAQSVRERVASVATEAPAWQELIERVGVTEYCDWQFPEYLYRNSDTGVSMVEHQRETLIQARQCLLGGNPDLVVFFKNEGEIRHIREPFVK